MRKIWDVWARIQKEWFQLFSRNHVRVTAASEVLCLKKPDWESSNSGDNGDPMAFGQGSSINLKTMLFVRTYKQPRGSRMKWEETNVNQEHLKLPLRIGIKYNNKKLNEDDQRRKRKAVDMSNDSHVKYMNTHELAQIQIMKIRATFVVNPEWCILLQQAGIWSGRWTVSSEAKWLQGTRRGSRRNKYFEYLEMQ